MWRRAILASVGSTAGWAISQKQKECEACTLGTACCLLTTAAMGTVQAILYFQKELEKEGRLLLAIRADEGDQGAQMCLAGMMYAANPDLAIGPLKQCSDKLPDCKALYALLVKGEDRSKLLTEAVQEIKTQISNLEKLHPDDRLVQIAPPMPPGFLPKPLEDEDEVELLKYVGADYTRSVISAITAKGMPSVDSSLTETELDAVRYIGAARGFVPFFYLLGRKAQLEGKKEIAANCYLDLMLTTTPEHAKHVMATLSEQYIPNATEAWRDRKVGWWAAGVASSRVELCRLYSEGINPVGLTDHEVRDNLNLAISTIPDLHKSLKPLFPKDDPVISQLMPTLESCKKAHGSPYVAGNDLEMCSEGLSIVADYLLESM